MTQLATSAPDAFEAARRRAAERLDILGTPRERRFDRLTRLAQQALGVPVAYVAVIDGDELWMKSDVGLDSDSYPRSATFCDTTIRLNEQVVVPDATLDERFADLATVTGEPRVRAYVGTPIVDADGVAVGTFCVVDTRPRTFSRAQLALLNELTSWVQQELLDSSENERARAVQRLLLPDRLPAPPGYEIAALYEPSRHVGGDVYLAGEITGGVGLAVADVMGKGVGAAILSATVRAAVRASVRASVRAAAGSAGATTGAQTVAATLADVSAVLQSDLEATDTLVTAFLALLDPQEHVLSFADAGHGLAVLADAAGGISWLGAGDLPLGVLPDAGWTGRSRPLALGDRLLIFSDGLLDLLGGTPRELIRVAELVARSAGAGDIIARVRELVAAGRLVDDVTALAVGRTA